MDSGLREHEELVKQYFGTIIPPNDNKFAALNSAVWSGGSFIYVPKGVKIELPLQAYFRINAENMGQFERTLIIVDEGAYVHYVEGCTAPIYSSDSLHSAVVEIVVKKGGRCRYTTIQNWSNNVYNLVTKRAVAYEDATMEWVDGNLGSKLTMKYPAIWLMGPRAHGEVLSIAFAGAGQHQDAGGKCVHVAPDTTSVITSKSISKNGGRAGYRGLLEVAKGATNSKSKVVCDALILDEDSRSDTYPYIQIDEDEVDIGHEATVSKIGEEQLFYLMSRGLTEAQASAMVVSGFVEPITKELPLEYAIEMNRLIELQMEGLGWLERRRQPATRSCRFRPQPRRPGGSPTCAGSTRTRSRGTRRLAARPRRRSCSTSTSPGWPSSPRAGSRSCARPRASASSRSPRTTRGSTRSSAGTRSSPRTTRRVWKHGLLVHVPKGVVLEKPLYVRIANSVEDGALFWRLLVVAEEQSRFTLIEEYVSARPDLPAYSNAVAELFVGQAAKLEYVSIQNLSQETWHFATHHARVERDARARLGRGRLRLEEREDPDPERPQRARARPRASPAPTSPTATSTSTTTPSRSTSRPRPSRTSRSRARCASTRTRSGAG